MNTDLSASSLDRPAPPAGVGPAELPAAQPVRRERKSEREKRWERRRRRIWGENILALFLVPAIILSAIWAVQAGLAALGTTPTALYQQIRAIANNKS